MRQRWTNGEKWLWITPLVFGICTLGLMNGAEAMRRTLNWPQSLATKPGDHIRFFALSRNGKVLAAGTNLMGKRSWLRGSGTVYLWDAKTLKPLSTIPPQYTKKQSGFVNGWDICGLTLAPDAKSIGFARVHEPWALYDVNTHKQKWQFSEFVDYAEFSNNGQSVALLSDRRVSVVRASDGQIRSQWKFKKDANSNDLAFSPDGTLIAKVGPYETNDPIEIYRVSDGHLVRRIPSEGTRSVHFSPDGRSLVAACSLINFFGKRDFGAFTSVRCFNVASGALRWQVRADKFGGKSPRSAYMFCDAIYSPDGKTVAAYQYEEGRVFLLDSGSGAILKTLTVGREAPTGFFTPPALAFAPDGKRLFARGEGAVLVWNLA